MIIIALKIKISDRECYTLAKIREPMAKRQKSQHMSPVMMGDCNTRLGKPKFKPIKVLFDSGTTSTIITHEYAKKLRINKSHETKWNTKGGNFVTKGTCNLMFRLPEIDSQ